MVASLLYFGHALETSRQSGAPFVYFRRRLRGAALLGAAPHPTTEGHGYGISCDSSTGTLMLFNQLSTLGTGIICYNQQKLQLIDNILQTSAVGIGVTGSGAVIGNQGNIDTTYDNIWQGNFSLPGAMIKTSNNAEKPTADTFFVQGIPTYNPGSNLFAISFANPIIDTVITPSGEYSRPDTPGCMPAPPLELRTFWTGKNPTSPSQDTSNNISTSQLDYKLIPNLFKDNFSARITLGTLETGEVDIYNIEGLLIESYIVGPGVNQLNLSNPELVGGVYIYKVIVNGEIKTNDKLVVVH